MFRSVTLAVLLAAACANPASFKQLEQRKRSGAPAQPIVCTGITLSTRSDYEAARDCEHIDGDLLIGALPALAQLEFPRLREVQGDITPVYVDLPHPLSELEMPALERVGGSLSLIATSLAKSEWPALREIAGSLHVDLSRELIVFSAPALEAIGEDLSFYSDEQLERIDLPALGSIGGDLALFHDYALRELNVPQLERIAGSAHLDGLVRLTGDDIVELWQRSDRSRELGSFGCCRDEPHRCETISATRCP